MEGETAQFGTVALQQGATFVTQSGTSVAANAMTFAAGSRWQLTGPGSITLATAPSDLSGLTLVMRPDGSNAFRAFSRPVVVLTAPSIPADRLPSVEYTGSECLRWTLDVIDNGNGTQSLTLKMRPAYFSIFIR